MPGMSSPKYSKSEVSQKFNLKTLLGYEPSEAQKELFFNLAVDKMVQRTSNGRDIDGNKFEKYSEAYAEKKGVSRSSVDLILSGDMLSSFEDSSESKNVLKIKVSEGKETLKSYNHNVGDTLPERRYFGFNDESALRSILSQVNRMKEETGKETRREASRVEGATLSDLRGLIRESVSLDFEGFDGES